MTIYQKELRRQLTERHPDASTAQVLDLLVEMGVVDVTRCKVLAVRCYVEQLVQQGCRKVDAMYDAAAHFCCSYEYVRKCMYYYKDVNLI